MTRRTLARRLWAVLAVVATVSVGSGLRTVKPADASMDWCWGDPVVSLNGVVVSINIGVQGTPDVVRAGVQAAHTTLYVPQGVDARVLSVDTTYFQEDVQIVPVAGSGQVSMVVSFAATQPLPAAAFISINGLPGSLTVSGSTTAGVVLSFATPAGAITAQAPALWPVPLATPEPKATPAPKGDGPKGTR